MVIGANGEGSVMFEMERKYGKQQEKTTCPIKQVKKSKSRWQMTARPGPKTVLMEAEEGQLETYLLYMADHGLPLRPRKAGAFITQLVKDRLVFKK